MGLLQRLLGLRPPHEERNPYRELDGLLADPPPPAPPRNEMVIRCLDGTAIAFRVEHGLTFSAD